MAPSSQRTGGLTLRTADGGMAGSIGQALEGAGYRPGDQVDLAPADEGLREIAQIISFFGLRRDVGVSVWEEVFHTLEMVLNGHVDPQRLRALRDAATLLDPQVAARKLLT